MTKRKAKPKAKPMTQIDHPADDETTVGRELVRAARAYLQFTAGQCGLVERVNALTAAGGVVAVQVTVNPHTIIRVVGEQPGGPPFILLEADAIVKPDMLDS